MVRVASVAVVASQVSSVGLAVVAKVSVSHWSGHVRYHRVVRQSVGDEAAVGGIRGGDAGVVVSVSVSLGIGLSISLGLTLLASEIYEGSWLVECADRGGDHRVCQRGVDEWGVGEWGVDKGGVVEDWMGHHLVTHLSWLLNYRLDKGSVGYGVSNGESERGRGKVWGWGKKWSWGHQMWVGQKGSGDRLGQEDGRVGFRPGSAQGGHGENSELKEKEMDKLKNINGREIIIQSDKSRGGTDRAPHDVWRTGC